jgi:alginate O-acetyltransferase complex protein AlgI
MLFNSYQFIFVFLPIALIGYQVMSRIHARAVVLWLGFISLVFYGWWQPSLLVILIGSVALNYTAAALISRRIPNRLTSSTWLYLAVILNLIVLGYYKYFVPTANFFSSTFSLSKHWAEIVLPLGISFFTFTQIAYLIDLSKGAAEQENFPDYLLFVTFFPHLIAGPILHHREMMPQFKRAQFSLNVSDLTVGATWFVLGLAKKVILADTFAESVYPVFHLQGDMGTRYAWVGALSYTMQLYFDFSGYSDMALGLARMFSIDFPLNFNSPYKSSSIIEVWQRWHMTLGRYIFTYIYNPVTRTVRDRRRRQGKGITKKDRASIATFVEVVALPLTFTMFIAGIWHGAGLQFLAFGLLHGIYMSINNAWRQFFPRQKNRKVGTDSFLVWLRHRAAIAMTMMFVTISLVFFRAESLGQAIALLSSMFGLHFGGLAPAPLSSLNRPLAYLVVGFAIVWALPNTQQILTRFKPSLQMTAWDQKVLPDILRWRPSTGWAVAVAVLFFVVLVQLQQSSTFLYFQF